MVNMLRSLSFNILIVVIVFIGPTVGKKWWKSTLEETNEIVKEIKGKISNFGAEDCDGAGYEIALCGNATIHQPEVEGKYCEIDGNNTLPTILTYNPVNGYYFYPIEYGSCIDWAVYDPAQYLFLLWGFDYNCAGDYFDFKNLVWYAWDNPNYNWVGVEEGCVGVTYVTSDVKQKMEAMNIEAKNERPQK